MNMNPMNMSNLLVSLGAQFPLLAVCFLGLILALVQMQRLPRVAMLVCAGLALLLLVAVMQPIIQPLIQNLALRSLNRRPGSMSFSLVFASVAFSFNMLRALAIGLIAYAAFVDRPLQAFMNPSPTGKTWPNTVGPG